MNSITMFFNGNIHINLRRNRRILTSILVILFLIFSFQITPGTSNIIIQSNWQELLIPGPSERWLAAPSQGPGETSYLFGGLNVSALDPTFFSDETWKYDHFSETMVLLPTTNTPTGRIFQTLTFDENRNELIMFGGLDNNDLEETWSFDLMGNWNQISTTGSPGPRGGHSAIYDPSTKSVLVYGGTTFLSGTTHDDIWSLSSTNTWTLKTPVQSPPARTYHSMVYLPHLRQGLIFGGQNSTHHYNDTWMLKLSTFEWTQINSSVQPAARAYHQSFYNPYMNRVILFGGQNSTHYFNDMWSFDFNTYSWTEVLPINPPPPARSGHILLYNPDQDDTVLFGGRNESSIFGDLWELPQPTVSNLVSTITWTHLLTTTDVDQSSITITESQQVEVTEFTTVNNDVFITETKTEFTVDTKEALFEKVLLMMVSSIWLMVIIKRRKSNSNN